MTTAPTTKPSLRHKLMHELREMTWIFAYLAMFFCGLATYSTVLLREFHVSYFAYSTALINALIMAKIILIGEYLRVGRRHEGKPLMLTAVIKALLFSILMAVFHVIEEILKHLIHGLTVDSAVKELTQGGLAEVGVRNLVFFCALIPFFAARELRRVMGEEKFYALLWRKGESALNG